MKNVLESNLSLTSTSRVMLNCGVSMLYSLPFIN